MKTSVIRRLNRRGVIAAKRVREILYVRIKLRQRPPRMLKIKQNIVIAAAEQNWMTSGINPMEKMGMRLHVKNVLNLF